jgi:hypothetical protein
MRWKLPLFVFIFAAGSLSSQAQVSNVWMVGLNDNGWPAGDGGGPNTSFLQENGVINPLPGNPVTAVEGPQGADNDYYFSGIYNTVVPSSTAFYGAYTPVGVVGANEEGAERAFAGGDNDLRYHFNLTAANITGKLLSITYEPLNLDDPANPANTDLRYGVEVYFNGVLVMPQMIIRPAQINSAITTPLFSPASVNATVGPADNIVSLRGINYNATGGGNWMGVDYIQLDSQVPEPSSALMIICGVLGVAPFLRRRR